MMILVVMGLVPALILTDVLIKSFVEGNIARGEQHRIFHGRILIRKVYNRGICLNKFDDHPEEVRIASLFSAVLLNIYLFASMLWHGRNIMKNIGLAFMTAGAWSNTIDRCLRHYVIDYFGFETKWKRLKDITFNLGDMFLFLGGAIVFLSSLFQGKRK